jgi:hypothetical protein
MFNNMITPKNARHILEEHCVSPRLFLEMQPDTQHGLISDMMMKQKSSYKLLMEFRKGAIAMLEMEKRKKNS